MFQAVCEVTLKIPVAAPIVGEDGSCRRLTPKEASPRDMDISLGKMRLCVNAVFTSS